MHDDGPSRPSGQLIRSSTAEFLIFTGQDGGASIEVRHEDETAWLTRRLMAKLFGTARTNSEHPTQFHKWATRVLRDLDLKGHVIDRKQMENGPFLDEDHHERLLGKPHARAGFPT